MPTTQGFERSLYLGIEACVLSDAMTDADLGRFTRTTVLGYRALQAATLPLPNGETIEGNGAAPANRTRAVESATGANQPAARRGRRAGQPTLAEQVYAWLIEQRGAMKRAEIVKAFEGLGYKASSLAGALDDLKKHNRAVSENGLWQAIPQPATATTGATAGAPATGQTTIAQEPESLLQTA